MPPRPQLTNEQTGNVNAQCLFAAIIDLALVAQTDLGQTGMLTTKPPLLVVAPMTWGIV